MHPVHLRLLQNLGLRFQEAPCPSLHTSVRHFRFTTFDQMLVSGVLWATLGKIVAAFKDACVSHTRRIYIMHFGTLDKAWPQSMFAFQVQP